MICKRCNREFKNISSHIIRTHHMNLEDYYLQYIGSKGKCLTCGNNTSFLGIKSGYSRFCCNRCVGLNPEIQKKKRITTKDHFGVEYPTQSKEVFNKVKQSNLEKYGVENPFNQSHVKEKAQINSHTEEANIKRGLSISKTKNQLFLDDDYKNKVIDKAKQHNLEKYGVEWPSKLEEQQQKISKSVKKLYEDPNYLSNIKYKYIYNNEHFDSSYELALYIYAIDHDESIIRKPCKFKYVDNNNKTHTYTPDFLYKNQLIEIKGDCFITEDGQLYNIYNKQLLPEKQECMKQHNVKLMTFSDLTKQFQYCINKYDNKYWYRLFKSH